MIPDDDPGVLVPHEVGDGGLRGAAGVGLVDTSSKKEEKDHE